MIAWHTSKSCLPPSCMVLFQNAMLQHKDRCTDFIVERVFDKVAYFIGDCADCSVPFSPSLHQSAFLYFHMHFFCSCHIIFIFLPHLSSCAHYQHFISLTSLKSLHISLSIFNTPYFLPFLSSPLYSSSHLLFFYMSSLSSSLSFLPSSSSLSLTPH